jgi:multicomponent Na+:H+ antiporter subunit E
VIYFSLNVLLAVLWMAINGNFSVSSLLMGFAVGYVVLVFASPILGNARYLRKLWVVIFFILYFLWELFRSSLRVAADVLHPNYPERVNPGIIAVPLDISSDVGVTMLANVISLTPGTLSLDVSDDKRVLYIHAMYVRDPEAVRREIKEGLERRVIEVLE